MKRVGTLIGLAATLTLAGVAAYRLLLTEEARSALRRSMREVRDTVQTVNDTLGEKQNNEEEALYNKQRTASMWRSVGY